ncbi:MAG: 50S ribosomal protein L6 [Maricaulis sp.]|jgi:large subunit ribosomal protein L6|uniref:50S ribosomal protein L6 n=1 Tax=Maricaulis sp. TaxID=1486257 RepID=UPI001B18FDF7|nr:50S ribosomal protein L6 [Maricaulis sp.]MBO6728259.1 50S ribosomal protein L6 [Maricaulis sp.]MBO6848757.1 50S ribosomal protein L6 [Maricaulis sp.]MBO6876576.1 50S ribosomal protein L6 [Maricaulis sp.]MDM7983223.1 50S ribosomal protein L6 [Maricaulis sp.]
MSRIGKLPVAVPAGVTATLTETSLTVKGPKGELSMDFVEDVTVSQGEEGIQVKPRDESKRSRAMWGMQRALVANLVQGVTAGYEKDLELVGVGYRAQMQGTSLKLSLGLSHDVIYTPPAGVTISCGKPTEVKVAGADKQKVGQVAAEIRRFRPPEPYKGKGIKYVGEYIRRKEGKKK